MTATVNGHIDIAELKRLAVGRWYSDIFPHFGFPPDSLDGNHGSCPNCNGVDRFRAMLEKPEGVVLCNQCFNQKNGDGIAAVAWRNNWPFDRTLKEIASYLGMEGGTSKPATDPVEQFANAKRIQVDGLRAYGARADHRGNLPVCRVPMWDQRRQQCSFQDYSTFTPEFSKGMSAKGMPAGLFVAEWPEPGDTVHLVEGVKDAVALRDFLQRHGLPGKVVGIPTSKLANKFVRLFIGCNVIIVPDRDETGEASAQITAARSKGVAAFVRIATLPSELKKTNGDGVREVLRSTDGDELLRQALADAVVWNPQATEDDLPPPEDGWEFTSLKCHQGRTDRANARRFLAAYRDQVRFCHAWNKWLVWDGMRWALDKSNAVLRLAMAISDKVWMDAKECLTTEVIDFARKTAGRGCLKSMLELAAADVSIGVDELDANPWLLNCPNGTLDLKTGKLRPHRREDCLTKLCPTNFNPEAGSYHWDRFNESIFDGNGLLISFVQRLCGSFLTGDVSEQILPIYHGGGSNGKSTHLGAVQGTLGPDYTAAAPAGILMEKKSDSHPTELAGLFGKRLVVAQETNAGARLAESTVKQLTGGDMISARRMREDFWDFLPTHKLVICSNHKPKVKGTDHAIWRRLVLIPFTRKFWNPDKGETGPEDLKQDKTLPVKLLAEREGILNWMVQGCTEWQKGGLRIPDSVRAATEEYRSEQDILGQFIGECCLTGQSFRVKFASFYESLEEWCNESGSNLPSRNVTGAYLKDAGYHDKHSGTRWYLGIALKEVDT